MSLPPLPPAPTSRTPRQTSAANGNSGLTSYSGEDMPPMVASSPRLPAPKGKAGTANGAGLNSAQRYLQNRVKRLFDSADYYSAPESERTASPVAYSANAFEATKEESNRLARETRPSSLSFELPQEIEVDDDDFGDDTNSDNDSMPRKPSHHLRRSSMEELLLENNAHETVKHAILEKRSLKRWDSGEFFSSPSTHRKMLATQAKEVLRQALDQAEADHQPRRPRRSSLSAAEYHEAGSELSLSGLAIDQNGTET